VAEDDPEISRACARAVNVMQLLPGDPEFDELLRAADEAETVDDLPDWIRNPKPRTRPRGGQPAQQNAGEEPRNQPADEGRTADTSSGAKAPAKKPAKRSGREEDPARAGQPNAYYAG
jgi:hypothetical protein